MAGSYPNLPALGGTPREVAQAVNHLINDPVKLSQIEVIPADTIVGNGTAASASPTSLTMAQVAALLPVFTSGLNGLVPTPGGTGTTLYLRQDGVWGVPPGTGGAGTVTNVSVVTANGVSGSVSNPTTTPAITLSLGAITPSSVAATGTVTGSNLSGTNTGDQDLTPYAPKASPTFTGLVTGSTSGFALGGVTLSQGTDGGSYIQALIQANSGNKSLVFQFAPSGTANASVMEFYHNSDLASTHRHIFKNSAGTLQIGGDGASLDIQFIRSNTAVVTINGTGISATGTVTGSNLSGTNTGDQTITLTGDVTGSGTGSFAATVSGLALSKLASASAASIVGATAAGAHADLTPAQAKTVLAITTSDVSGLANGTYTPTLTNSTNVAASTAYQCQYMRVGSVVTVSGRVDIDPTSASVNTVLFMSLPIASNFSAGPGNECGGVATGNGNAQSMAILADTTGHRAELQGLPVSSANASYFFTFTYVIV